MRKVVVLTKDSRAGLESLVGLRPGHGDIGLKRGYVIWAAYTMVYVRCEHFGSWLAAGLVPLAKLGRNKYNPYPVEFDTDTMTEEAYIMFSKYLDHGMNRSDVTVAALRLLMWCHDWSMLSGEKEWNATIELPKNFLLEVDRMTWLPQWYKE